MICDLCSHCSNWESNNSEILRVLVFLIFFLQGICYCKCIIVFQVTLQVLPKSWAYVYFNIFIWHAEKTILSIFTFNIETLNLPDRYKKKILHNEDGKHWYSYLGKLVSCHPWRYLKLSWTQPWATSLNWKLALFWEVRLDDLNSFQPKLLYSSLRNLQNRDTSWFWVTELWLGFLLIILFCDFIFFFNVCITECINKGKAL